MNRCLVIAVLSLMAIACSTEPRLEKAAAQPTPNQSDSTRPSTANATPAETGEPALHAVKNDRLQQIMRQINDLVYAQLSSEINLGQQRQLKTEEIAKTAAELAASEQAMVSTLPSLGLKADEQTTFLALAEELRINAADMQDLANRNQIQAIPARLETITNTCTSCHVLFRKSRSLLEKCKDPRYTC